MNTEKAESVKHIDRISVVESEHGIGVHIHIDDESIESEALRVASYQASDRSEHRKIAEKTGDGMATKAAEKCLFALGAFDKANQTTAQIHTNHEVKL